VFRLLIKVIFFALELQEYVLPPCELFAISALTDLLRSSHVDGTLSSLATDFRGNNYIQKLLDMFVMTLEKLYNLDIPDPERTLVTLDYSDTPGSGSPQTQNPQNFLRMEDQAGAVPENYPRCYVPEDVLDGSRIVVLQPMDESNTEENASFSPPQPQYNNHTPLTFLDLDSRVTYELDPCSQLISELNALNGLLTLLLKLDSPSFSDLFFSGQFYVLIILLLYLLYTVVPKHSCKRYLALFS